MSSVPVTPLARSVLNIKYASARNPIGLPKRPKRCGASAAKPASNWPQVSASRFEKLAICAVVAAMSVVTPHQRPFGKAEAKGLFTGTNSAPCWARSAAFSLKNALPANSDRFIAAQS